MRSPCKCSDAVKRTADSDSDAAFLKGTSQGSEANEVIAYLQPLTRKSSWNMQETIGGKGRILPSWWMASILAGSMA